MKHAFCVFVLMLIYLLLSACGSSVPATPLQVLPPTVTITETALPTFTPLPSQTATAIIVTPEATQAYVRPTLVPTIDPAQLPERLSKSFSVQTMKGVNGHPIRQITGWEYGFGGGFWSTSCPGVVWLDSTHLLLYPAAGQVDGPEGYWAAVNTVPQPVVIDLESGSTWLPPVKPLEYAGSCNYLYWSQKMELLITSRLENDISNITTYKSDGRKVADYQGRRWSISPSGTKVMIDENTLMDLRTNTRTQFSWPRFEAEEPWYGSYYWTYPDETQVYHCCSYYADLSSGKSFRFIVNHDFQFTEIQTEEDYFSTDYMLPYMNGEWVRDNTFFLVWWSWIDDGDMRFLPMINPREKIIYDVRAEAGISPDISCPDSTASDSHVWLECYEKSYLIDLYTFEATEYPGFLNTDIGWSADDRFAWLQGYDSESKATYSVLSTSSREIKALPIQATSFDWHDLTWHAADHILTYLSEDQQKLGLVDAETLSVQEIPLPTTFRSYVWSDRGEKLVLLAEDGSLWQAEYGNLENLEQLTEPMPDVGDVFWSPDGNYIIFVGGHDIYIVETAG